MEHTALKQQILDLVDRKIKAGQTESVTPLEAQETTGTSATIYDLTELLQRSLNKGSKSEALAEKPDSGAKGPRAKPRAAVKASAVKAPVKPPAKKKAA